METSADQTMIKMIKPKESIVLTIKLNAQTHTPETLCMCMT